MAGSSRPASRWVDVTPLVFLINSAVGFLAMGSPALVLALLPVWAHGPWCIGAIALPGAIALLGWRAYSARVSEPAKANRVGWMAFWSALSWPMCVLGAMLVGVQLASPAQLRDEGAGEMLAFVSFLLGSAIAIVVSWLLSRRIVHSIWPKPPVVRA